MTTTTKTTAPVNPGAPTPGGDRRTPTSSKKKENSIMPDNTDDPFAPLPGHVIDLDDPTPELERWNELHSSVESFTIHGGDASKIALLPRPAWSDPNSDLVGSSRMGTFYRSSSAYVIATYAGGKDAIDEEGLFWARCYVNARMSGTGLKAINLGVVNYADRGEVDRKSVGMTTAETRQLIAVLEAAVALLESE